MENLVAKINKNWKINHSKFNKEMDKAVFYNNIEYLLNALKFFKTAIISWVQSVGLTKS